jgi:hypothetical protein
MPSVEIQGQSHHVAAISGSGGTADLDKFSIQQARVGARWMHILSVRSKAVKEEEEETALLIQGTEEETRDLKAGRGCGGNLVTS